MARGRAKPPMMTPIRVYGALWLNYRWFHRESHSRCLLQEHRVDAPQTLALERYWWPRRAHDDAYKYTLILFKDCQKYWYKY